METTYLKNTNPDQQQNGREERVQESAMICEQSSVTDLQQSAEYTKTIMQWTINPCKTPEGSPTGHILPNGETAGCKVDI